MFTLIPLLSFIETKNKNQIFSKLVVWFVCLLSSFQFGIYNSIKTNKNQPSSLYKKWPSPSYKETLSKSTDYDPFLYELGVPWCANYK